MGIPQTIQIIRQHMEQQADKNEPDNFVFNKNRAEQINRNGIIGMQRMKTDAATVRCENGVGQQMVRVHQHGCDQN